MFIQLMEAKANNTFITQAGKECPNTEQIVEHRHPCVYTLSSANIMACDQTSQTFPFCICTVL